jgi:hypothetical protein
MLSEIKRMQQLAGISKLNESESMSEDMNQSYASMSQDRGDTGSSIEFEVLNDMGNKVEIHYKITPNSQSRSKSAARGLGAREPQEGEAVVTKQDWITVNGTSFGPIKWK